MKLKLNIGDLVCLKTPFRDAWKHGVGIIVEQRLNHPAIQPRREMFKVYWTTFQRSFWETGATIEKLPISKDGDNE